MEVFDEIYMVGFLLKSRLNENFKSISFYLLFEGFTYQIKSNLKSNSNQILNFIYFQIFTTK